MLDAGAAYPRPESRATPHKYRPSHWNAKWPAPASVPTQLRYSTKFGGIEGAPCGIKLPVSGAHGWHSTSEVALYYRGTLIFGAAVAELVFWKLAFGQSSPRGYRRKLWRYFRMDLGPLEQVLLSVGCSEQRAVDRGLAQLRSGDQTYEERVERKSRADGQERQRSRCHTG